MEVLCSHPTSGILDTHLLSQEGVFIQVSELILLCPAKSLWNWDDLLCVLKASFSETCLLQCLVRVLDQCTLVLREKMYLSILFIA